MSRIQSGVLRPGSQPASDPSTPPTSGAPGHIGIAATDKARRPEALQEIVMIVGGEAGKLALEKIDRETKGTHSLFCFAGVGARTGAAGPAMNAAIERGATALDSEIVTIRQLADGNFRLLFKQGAPVDCRHVIFAADRGAPMPALELPEQRPVKTDQGWQIAGRDGGPGIALQGGVATGISRREAVQDKRAGRELRLQILDQKWEALADLKEQKRQGKAQGKNIDQLRLQFSNDLHEYVEAARKFDAETPPERLHQDAVDVLEYFAGLDPHLEKAYTRFEQAIDESAVAFPLADRRLEANDVVRLAGTMVNADVIAAYLQMDIPVDEKCMMLERLQIPQGTIARVRQLIVAGGHLPNQLKEEIQGAVGKFFEASLVPPLLAKSYQPLL